MGDAFVAVLLRGLKPTIVIPAQATSNLVQSALPLLATVGLSARATSPWIL